MLGYEDFENDWVEIGDNVKIYRGVTVGNNIVTYSGATIHGGETTVGDDAVIGNNA